MKFGRFDIQKSVVRDLDNLNSLHDMTSVLRKSPNIPNLLTTILGESFNTEFLQTDTFEHDVVSTKVAEIKDKAFHERGAYFDAREDTKTHLFKVPSFGIPTHIRPRDALKSRVAGTQSQLENIASLIDKDVRDMRKSFALLEERAIAYTITAGGLYVPNGSVASVDFYQEYTGVAAASRPSVDFKLGTDTFYPREAGEDARALINDSLLDGQSVDGYVALCGRDFFKNRISHPKEEQAMVDRSGLDGQDPLIKRLGNYAQQYRMYRGADDILYIQYDAKVGGTPLIAADVCYIMPVNTTGIFTKAYAPAETMKYVNTTAEREYGWRMEDEFSGTKIFMESNFGIFLQNPNSIIKGTSST